MSPIAINRLRKEYKEQHSSPEASIVAGPVPESDLFTWLITLECPDDTDFEGAVLEAEMKFPSDFPLQPPKLRFKDADCIFHPNIYENGEVCISILHPPGDDPFQYESADERWSPLQNIGKIILSIMSILGSPNIESPANIKAADMLKKDAAMYRREVRRRLRNLYGL